jgi:dihydrofolate reductase
LVKLVLGPVARARNGVIGRDGGIPWRLKSDMALFKATTMGKPVIMGRKTWESLPKRPLPGRTNLVVTRDGSYSEMSVAHGAVICERFDEAVQIAREQAEEDGVDEFCVIGGADIYALALPKARRIYLTEVMADVAGDVVFPPFDETAWTEVRREAHAAGPDDEYDFVFRVLERK